MKYRLGLRAIKTAIAVFFCLLVAIIFNRTDTLFGSIAAIMCMQQTYDQTYNQGLHRLVGTLVGGVVGYAVLQAVIHLPNRDLINLVMAPLCILVVIYLCNVLKKKGSVGIGCIVLLSVLVPSEFTVTDALFYVINRVIDTSIGIVIAMAVNKFVFPIKSNPESPEP